MNDPTVDAIAALEDYLRRYPSGNFAELARVRLDRLLASRGEEAISLVASADNPFSKGYAAARTDWRVGDRYEYRFIDLYTGIVTPRTYLVTSVSDLEIVLNDGGSILDLLGNTVFARGLRFSDNQNFPAEYALRKKWVSRYTWGRPNSERRLTTEVEWVVVDREETVVPAGRFNAFRVEGVGWGSDGDQRQFTYWMAPEKVRRALAYDQRQLGGTAFKRDGRYERRELVSYYEAPP